MQYYQDVSLTGSTFWGAIMSMFLLLMIGQIYIGEIRPRIIEWYERTTTPEQDEPDEASE